MMTMAGLPRRPESLAARWGAGVGDASYALYLLYPFVIRAIRVIFWRTGLIALLGPWAFIALALAISFTAALFTYRWLEKPLTRYVRRLLGARGRNPATATPIPCDSGPRVPALRSEPSEIAYPVSSGGNQI